MKRRSTQPLQRRTLAKLATLAGLGALTPVRLDANQPSLDELDPRQQIAGNYHRLRNRFQVPDDVFQVALTLWGRYKRDGIKRYGEWALIYLLFWWQTLPPGKPRIQAAQIGQKLSKIYENNHPHEVVGPYWLATFFGSEGISRGPLNSINMIPTLSAKLDRASEIDSSYYYGSVHMVRAKMYIKLPPFPMSTGDLDKGLAELEKARQYQQGRFAMWYLVLAEAEHQRAGETAARDALARLSEVCPDNLVTAFVYEVSMFMAEKLAKALDDGRYNKYTYDPLLESIEELRGREIPFPGQCGIRK